MEKLVYTAKELSVELNMRIRKINLLRQLGAIKAMKRGKCYLYTHDEVMKFLTLYCDADLSDATTIRAEVISRTKKGLPERPPSKKESPKSNNRINNPIKLYHENGKIKIV